MCDKFKFTVNDVTSASYLEIYLLLKLNTKGKLTTQLYDKRDDFNFSIVNLKQYSNFARMWILYLADN
jgi:hypothetical protein